MKRFLITFVLALIVFNTFGQTELVKVRGKGVGADRMEALKDAYRDAVEQAVGLYVDAEQMVKNEDLVKDQILTQSNAYIEKYKIAKESKSDTGLITVTILAEVRKRDLVKKIRGVIPVNTIDLSEISKNLHAQIVTDFKANDDAVSIIRNELKDLQPLKQLFKASLNSIKPVVEPVKEDPSLVRLWYPVKLEVDADRYYKDFVPRWTRILEQIKIGSAKKLSLKNELSLVKAYDAFINEKYGNTRKGKTGIMTRCEEKSDNYVWLFHSNVWPLSSTGLSLNEEYEGMNFLSTLIGGEKYILHGFGEKWFGSREKIDKESFNKCERYVRRFFITRFGSVEPLACIPEGCDFGIVLIKSARGNTLQGSMYSIPYSCVCEIAKWQNKVTLGNANGDFHWMHNTPVKTSFSLCFSDSKNEEVVATVFAVNNIDTFNFACVTLDEGRHPDYLGSRKWLITPLVGGVAQSYIKWVSVDVPKDDVAKIAKVRISVEE